MPIELRLRPWAHAYLLSQFSFDEVTRRDVELPPRVHHPDYTREPIPDGMYVPRIY